MFLLALEWSRGLMFWTGCGCIPPVQLGAVVFELCLFASCFLLILPCAFLAFPLGAKGHGQ